MNESKQCSNCVRWTSPLSRSACNYLQSENQLPFKKNEKGIYYCDDFKLSVKGGNEI